MNKINPIFEALSNIDERHVPVNHKKRFPKQMMIAAAAVLVIGFGSVTAVMMNRKVDANDQLPMPNVVTGNYYLGGDKNADMYFELTDDYLALRINGDSYTIIKDFLIESGEGEQMAANIAKNLSEDYCAENPYVISIFGTKTTPYQIMIHWNEGFKLYEDQVGLTYGGIGFTYDGIDTITCHPFGDFILVE